MPVLWEAGSEQIFGFSCEKVLHAYRKKAVFAQKKESYAKDSFQLGALLR